MKSCHICERIVKLSRALDCSNCRKAICLPCSKRYLSNVTSTAVSSQTLANQKVNNCVICLKQCPCIKCKPTSTIIYSIPNNSTQKQAKLASLISEEQPIPETGLFKGKKISDLPTYLQRVYLKKQALYTKHQIGNRMNGSGTELPQNNEPQQQQENRLQEIKEAQDEGVKNMEEQSNRIIEERHVDGRNIDSNEYDQIEDYESQFPSRRKAHLQKDKEDNQNNDMAAEPHDEEVPPSHEVAQSDMQSDMAVEGQDHHSNRQQPSRNGQSSSISKDK